MVKTWILLIRGLTVWWGRKGTYINNNSTVDKKRVAISEDIYWCNDSLEEKEERRLLV